MTPDQLSALYARAFPATRPWTSAEFQNLLSRDEVILSCHGSAFVLGQVTLDEAEILTLATDPAARRRGHARAALAAFEGAAAACGVASVFLEVAADNHAAQGLYGSSGYDQVGLRARYYARPSGESCDALILRKVLSSD